MTERMRTVRDPFTGRDVQISERLVDRLRGKYASGPHLPNGKPEFGWRQFEAPPIQHEAAERIEAIEASHDTLLAEVARLKEALAPFAAFKFEMLADLVDGETGDAVISIEADDGSVVLSELLDEHFLAARAALSGISTGRDDKKRIADLEAACLAAKALLEPTDDRTEMAWQLLDEAYHERKLFTGISTGRDPIAKEDDGWRPSHRHVKSGGEYLFLGEGRIQSDVPLTDMAPVAIYRGSDGRLWARRADEFPDRFEAIFSPATPEQKDGD